DPRRRTLARPGAHRIAPAPLRLPRRAGPRAPGSAHGPRGAPAPALRAVHAAGPGTEPPGAERAPGRGSSLGGRRQRGVPGGARRGAAGDGHAPPRDPPPGVPGRLVRDVLLPAADARTARRRGERRLAPGPARLRSVARRG